MPGRSVVFVPAFGSLRRVRKPRSVPTGNRTMPRARSSQTLSHPTQARKHRHQHLVQYHVVGLTSDIARTTHPQIDPIRPAQPIHLFPKSRTLTPTPEPRIVLITAPPRSITITRSGTGTGTRAIRPRLMGGQGKGIPGGGEDVPPLSVMVVVLGPVGMGGGRVEVRAYRVEEARHLCVSRACFRETLVVVGYVGGWVTLHAGCVVRVRVWYLSISTWGVWDRPAGSSTGRTRSMIYS